MNYNDKLSKKQNIKLITLKNGVKVVLVPRIGLKTVVIEWFLKIGSKYENVNEFGLSHYLEHMSFKGTNNRSAKDINNEIDIRGASYNAGTGLQTTSYFIKTVRENIVWATELLDNILFDSVFNEEEFEKEKKVIIEEIKMYADNPMMGLSGDFSKQLFSETKIGCWDISAGIDDIKKYSYKDLINYRNKFWKAENMVIVIAGDVGEEKELVKNIENRVGKRIFEKNLNKDIKLDIKWGKEKEIIKKRKDIDQAHIAIGVPAYPSDSKNKYIIKLIEIMVAGNSSSRLYQLIREDRGYSYYIHSISESIVEAGYFAIQTGVPQDKATETIDLIKNELINFSKTVNEKELEMAKQYIEGKLKMAVDSSTFWTNWLGSRVLMNKSIVGPEKMINKYRTVTLDDVKRVCEELFKEEMVYSLLVTK